MAAPGVASGGPTIRTGGTGLVITSGTLNGSSPAANLACANIKGKWIEFHFASPTRTGQRLPPGMDSCLFIALK